MRSSSQSRIGSDSGPVIEALALNKRYGGIRAVDGVSFTVERGEIFAILGPNGAGKTRVPCDRGVAIPLGVSRTLLRIAAAL